MNNYKTYYLSIFVFFACITIAKGNEGLLQDPVPQQREVNESKEKKQKKKPKVADEAGGEIKAVPRARRQAKPNIIKPNVDVVRPVRPLVRPKVKTPVRVKVNI